MWLAEEVETGRKVALKYFTAQSGGPVFGELNHAMQRSHPNIVPLLDFTYLPGGDSFLVFEHVAGGSLRDWLIEHESCAAREALLIIRDICSALSQIHQDGYVHCDIKPENILRSVGEADSQVAHKLIDFGIARNRLKGGPNSHLLGSPAYMAPEQFRDDFSPSSDLYSVGVILYELLAGDRPFIGTADVVARAHLSQPVPDIPDLDSEVQGFLHNLLQKDPHHRVATGAAALRTIDLLLNLNSPVAPAGSSIPRITAAPARSLDLGKSTSARVKGRYTIPLTPVPPRLLEVENRLLLSIDLGSHLEFYDGIIGQFRNQMLSKTGPALHFPGEAGVVYSVNQRVNYWDASLNTSRELAEFCPRARFFAFSPDHSKLAWLGDKKCEILHLEQNQRTELSAVQSHNTTGLTWLGSDYLVVAAGPSNPKLRVFDHTGSSIAEIELPGPVLYASENSICPMWVALDHDHPESLAVIGVDEDQTWHQWRIPKDRTVFDFAQRCILTLSSGGELLKWSPRDQGRPITQLAASTDGFALSPTNRFGITWRDTNERRDITVYEFYCKN